MKLNQGDILQGQVSVSGQLSDKQFQVRVLELMHQGEHFYIYKAEDSNGTHVCLKVIRYRVEKNAGFSSAVEYIEYRRNQVFHEHYLLQLSHPCLPESLALMIVDNNCSDSGKIFRQVAEWKQLQEQEPVLIQELFLSSPISEQKERLANFSGHLRRQLMIRLCYLYLDIYKEGFSLENMQPEHILIPREKDLNLQLVGLHRSRSEKKRKSNSPFYGEDEKNKKNRKEEKKPIELTLQDIYNLGQTFYYLLTADSIEQKKEDSGDFMREKRSRLEHALFHDSKGSSWLVELVMRMIATDEYKRPFQIKNIIEYLKKPPVGQIRFQIENAEGISPSLSFEKIPSWVTELLLRIEVLETEEIIEKKYEIQENISLPLTSYGDILCSVQGTRGEKKTWWEEQLFSRIPQVQLRPLENLPPDKFGFTWNTTAELQYVLFSLVDRYEEKTTICQATGHEVILPPEEVSLPYYENLKIEAIAYFDVSGQEMCSAAGIYQTCLIPPSRPLYPEQSREGLFLTAFFSQEQAERSSQMELLHNDFPIEPEKVEIKEQKGGQAVTFLVPIEKLSLFISHQFYVRSFLEELGWNESSILNLELESPPIKNFIVQDDSRGFLNLTWSSFPHYQFFEYRVYCEKNFLISTKESSHHFSLNLEKLKKICQGGLEFSVQAFYRDGENEKISSESSYLFTQEKIKSLFSCQSDYSVTPFATRFQIKFSEYNSLLESLHLSFFRQQEKGLEEILTIVPITKNVALSDENVEVGSCYRYSIVVEELEFCFLEQSIEIPPVEISSRLHKLGYRQCTWALNIAPHTLSCILGEIELIREGHSKRRHSLPWDEKKNVYYFEDIDLTPGQDYQYKIHLLLENGESYRCDLGKVTTKKFTPKAEVELSYNHANIRWYPSPEEEIESIQIFDETERLLASTHSEEIALENLEPSRKYQFPLKYKYQGGYLEVGDTLDFQTLPYNIEVETVHEMSDALRLHWEIPDFVLAAKIQEFTLDVSSVGKHILSASTRSVLLKQLHFSTHYKWALYAQFKSNHRAAIATGEFRVTPPELKVDITVGLVHHLKWSYSSSSAVEKIEVHRGDLPLIETNKHELYDSDFKGGAEVLYRFYYLLNNKERVLASEKKIQPLSMKKLFQAIEIKDGIGSLHWNFEKLKQFPYLKKIELYQKENQKEKKIYEQEQSEAPFIFLDEGSSTREKPLGLSNNPVDFELAVIGEAPSARKCKKKWTLSLKGIQCQYPDLPENFSASPEHCCVFLSWSETPTSFLEEIIVTSTHDGRVIYKGPNQQFCHCDDEGRGSFEEVSYLIEMQYRNHKTSRFVKVYWEDFSLNRLEVEELRLDNRELEVCWNPQVPTSITHLGWKKNKGKGLFTRFIKPNFTELKAGQLVVPLEEKDTTYCLIFRDRHGHIFQREREVPEI